ncbi:MAG: hypothetical protein ABI305_10590 [Tepidiformaceae bacterium]
MDQPGDQEPESIRELFIEVAELLEAIVIALQTESDKAETSFVLREAVRRVVRLREHLSSGDDLPASN